MGILVGLDVSLASTSVCAIGANGKTVNEAKVPSDPGSLAGHLRGLPGSVAAVGLEPGLLPHVSPLDWEHITLTGDFDCHSGADGRKIARSLHGSSGEHAT